ncbi:hypothetical protein Tco_1475032 [Tanacetum coccineum]
MRDIVRLKTERELVRIKINDGNAFWNEIGVNAGVSKLMLLSINLLLPVLVYAARHSLTAVRHKLMLPDITSYCWFWATAKAKTVNGERQIQALVDKKKVIITEKSVRSDLMLEDAEGIECLPNDVIFEQLTLIDAKTIAWNEFSSTMASVIICLATNQNFNFSKYIFDHMMKNLKGGVKFLMYPRFMQVFLDKQVKGMSKLKGIYVTPSHTKKIFANMKREGKGFSRRITHLFQTMMVQVLEDMGEDSAAPTDSHSTPIITQPSSSKPQKKKSKRKQRKDSGTTKPIPDEATNKEPISTPSCNPPQSAKTAQAKEIDSIKKRVKQLEKRKKSITLGLKRLRKVGSASRVESSNDVSLGAQEDASKQGRKIADLDADAEVTLIDETQERYDKEMLFEIQDDLQVVTTASAITTVDELTQAQTLIEIKAAKPKAVTTSATTITSVVARTRPKAKGIVFHDQEEQASAFTPIKKDQIALDEELALRLHVEEQVELEKERVAQEEASRASIIKELDRIQAMIEADKQ